MPLKSAVFALLELPPVIAVQKAAASELW